MNVLTKYVALVPLSIDQREVLVGTTFRATELARPDQLARWRAMSTENARERLPTTSKDSETPTPTRATSTLKGRKSNERNSFR